MKISRRDAGKALLAGSASLLAAKVPFPGVTGLAPANPPKLELWYSQPAKEWTEALPVGNGRLGAMIIENSSNKCLATPHR